MALLAQIEHLVLAVIAVFFVVALLWVTSTTRLFMPWLQAKIAGVPLSLPDLVGMTFRRVNPRPVVQALILTHQAGIELPLHDAQMAYLHGANLPKIAQAMVRAKHEDLRVTFQELVDADLQQTPAQT